MELPSKLRKYLDIEKAIEPRSYKVYTELGDGDRKALFYALLEKFKITSPNFEDKGITRRANIILCLESLTRKGDEEFGELFKGFLYHQDSVVFYIAIVAYARCMQEKAYESLLDIVFNRDIKIEMRIYALEELTLISGQRFITNQPGGVSYERAWKESDFPLELISEWDRAGRPKGNAHDNAYTLHEKILNPDDKPIDKLILNIHTKYYVKGARNSTTRMIIDGKINIGKPSKCDVDAINAKWTLPVTYKYFIENFTVRSALKQEITVYCADELIERQLGFAVTLDGAVMPEWNPNHLVIADWNGDSMYCIDLSKGENSPVYHFYHDDWKFKKYANSFLEFLTKIV